MPSVRKYWVKSWPGIRGGWFGVGVRIACLGWARSEGRELGIKRIERLGCGIDGVWFDKLTMESCVRLVCWVLLGPG